MSMSLSVPLNVYISLSFIRFARASSHVSEFNGRQKFLTAIILKQGYRYDKLRKAFSKFFGIVHFELIANDLPIIHFHFLTFIGFIFILTSPGCGMTNASGRLFHQATIMMQPLRTMPFISCSNADPKLILSYLPANVFVLSMI